MSERKLGEGWFSAESISFDDAGGVIVHSKDLALKACGVGHKITMEIPGVDEQPEGYFKFGGVAPCPPPVDGAPRCEDFKKRNELK